MTWTDNYFAGQNYAYLIIILQIKITHI